MGENSTRGGTPYRNHIRLPRFLQASSPRTRSTQASQGRVRNHDRARSDAAIEKPVGITPTRRTQEGRKSTTMRRLSCVERSHCARQVFRPHMEDFAQHLHGKRFFFFFFKNRSHPRLLSNPDRAGRRQENRDHDTLRTFRSNQHDVWASKRRANVSKVCR